MTAVLLLKTPAPNETILLICSSIDDTRANNNVVAHVRLRELGLRSEKHGWGSICQSGYKEA
jgi:hypothetical protein